MFKHASNVVDLEIIPKPKIDQRSVVDDSRWKNAIKLMNIQRNYHNCSLDNCQLLHPAIVALGKKWINADRRPNLYIHGNTGSGKTYFATSLFRELVEKKYPWLIFVRSYDLDDELLASINGNNGNHEKTVLQKYCEVPILFIDDLGVERPSDRIIRQYYSIIDSRVGEGLLTVITSNCSKSDFPLGDRIKSRLEHFCNIEFPKRDIRKTIELATL
jgi:DNA replication protein DnaC